MAKSARRPVAVLVLRRLGKLGDFIFKAKEIVDNITQHSGMYDNPVPLPGSVSGSISDLEKAQLRVNKREAGSVAARDQAYTKVLEGVRGLQSYVQNLADNAADEEEAVIFITTAGFSVKMTNGRNKAPLEARNGKVSGSVFLQAKAAGKRASYDWQWSDDNGTNWVNVRITLQAKTTVSNLTPVKRYLFRVRSVTKTGAGEWTDAVALVVA